MLRSMPYAWLTPTGEVYRLYTSLANRPHLLIAGATGSGKTVTVNGILYSVLVRCAPSQAKFILIDPKKVELVRYSALPHCIRYASEPTDIVDALDFAISETDRRFSVMQKQGIREYNGPDLYVIIDELADLMVSNKKATLPPLQKLAQIGRAAHVHIIACTQNVMAVTIPTVLKCNFTTILGLRTATKAQSRYLIDSPGCEELPDPKRAGKGFGFLRDGADLTRHTLPMYPDEDIDRLINWWTSSACRIEKGA